MKSAFIGLLLFGAMANATVGGVDGGGGKSVVCRDNSGAITSAEVLDLYEGRIQFGLSIQESPEPKKVQIQNALNRIPATFRGRQELSQKLRALRVC